MKRNIFRVLLRSISFTTALFIFQACYGSPQDFGLDLHVDGKVLAKSSGLPIKGIRVSVLNNVQYVFTDEQGRFSLYTEKMIKSLWRLKILTQVKMADSLKKIQH